MSPGSLFEGSRENTLRNSGAALIITVLYRTAQWGTAYMTLTGTQVQD